LKEEVEEDEIKMSRNVDEKDCNNDRKSNNKM
jgi:hypothetical protein